MSEREPILRVQLPALDEHAAAYAVRGYQMGAIRDGWLVICDDRELPPHEGLIDQLCVVRTADHRVLVRFLKKGRKPNTYDLLSVTGAPEIDAVLTWASPVQWIRPYVPSQEESAVLAFTY